MTTIPLLQSPVSRLLTAALVLLCCFAAPLAAQTPTLAELAKKEQERRKKLNAPTRVITKEDLPPSAVAVPPAAATPAAGPAAAQAAATAAEAPPETPKDEKGEEWWRQRMTVAREGLRRNELFAEALQSRMNALAADVASRDDPAQREQLSQERQKAVQELARVQGEVEKLKKEMVDIEEEARLAGVPPGWLR